MNANTRLEQTPVPGLPWPRHLVSHVLALSQCCRPERKTHIIDLPFHRVAVALFAVTHTDIGPGGQNDSDSWFEFFSIKVKYLQRDQSFPRHQILSNTRGLFVTF